MASTVPRLGGAAMDDASGALPRPAASSARGAARSPSSRRAYATVWRARRRLGSWCTWQNSSASCRSARASRSPDWYRHIPSVMSALARNSTSPSRSAISAAIWVAPSAGACS